MNEKPIENVTPNYEEDWLLEVDDYEEQTLTEEEQFREKYTDASPEDYENEVIICDQIRLFMSNKDKTSKAGNEYRSHNNITKLYIDSDETKVALFDEMFSDYTEETDILVARGQNPVVRLLQVLTNNPNRNYFKIKYTPFCERVKKIDQLKLEIYSYNVNGFEKHSFKVLAYSEK